MPLPRLRGSAVSRPCSGWLWRRGSTAPARHLRREPAQIPLRHLSSPPDLQAAALGAGSAVAPARLPKSSTSPAPRGGLRSPPPPPAPLGWPRTQPRARGPRRDAQAAPASRIPEPINPAAKITAACAEGAEHSSACIPFTRLARPGPARIRGNSHWILHQEQQWTPRRPPAAAPAPPRAFTGH